MGPGAAQNPVPMDDPPPYSLTDPCQRDDLAVNLPWEEATFLGTTERAAGYSFRLQDLHQPLSSISLASSIRMEAAPPYETVMCEQNIPLPLVPLDALKNSTDNYLNRII